MPDDQRPIDESIAEDALAALAGRECEHGGGILDPRTGQCEDESHTHCRWFCGDAYRGHQFISWNDNDGYDGPDVPLPPARLGPVSEWSDEWKEAAFGDIPQLGTYYEEIEDGDLPDLAAFEIAVLVAEQLAVEVHAEQWEQTMSLASGCGTVVYAKDPGRARAELVTRFEELGRRFEQLAVSASGIPDIRAEEALAILADLECPSCNAPVTGPRPWYCSECRTAVCLTCQEISNADGCRHLLPTEGRPGWDGKTCVACGTVMAGLQCSNCLSVHCPFCGVRSWAWRGHAWMVGETRCARLIASWEDSSGEWWEEPDIGLDRLDGFAVAEHDDEAVRSVFGELADLAEEIEGAQRAHGEPGPLAPLIRSSGLTSIADVFWDDQNGMSSDTGTDYFAANPIAAVDALRDLVDRLVACREHLNALRDEAR